MTGYRLPPLNALRAFEATARHLSVKSAADELCVTPGAVSQLLKTLELHLGIKLFRRVNRGIFLTDAGQAYLPPIRNAFRQITEATRRVAASADTASLTVSTTPFFAAAWLVPRLKAFQDAYPDTDLRIVTGTALADFSRDGVDVAIRHGLGRYPGLRSERVLVVEVIPVAAASLVAKRGVPASPGELARWPHVHDANRQGWNLWCQAQGISNIGTPRGPSFDDPGLLMNAVLAGQGAGLLPAAMVASELAQGRLVRLADVVWMEEFAYYLVYPEASHQRPNVTAFREWILDAASADNAPPASMASASTALDHTEVPATPSPMA
jgi:LysR family transcriptional regulator, glycine cleavage system transcriptional activator